MQGFIDKTFKPVFIIGGIGTAAANLDAFFPGFAVENVQKLEFVQDYTIFVQHWGIMVGLMGIFMVAAAFIESWRVPILLYSLIEKAFMVFLVVSNAHLSFSAGFYLPAAMDAFIVLYSILYFWSARRRQGDFRAGISVRGVALDSKGNLWVVSNMSLDFPPPKIPKGVSIMKQFQLVLEYLVPRLSGGKTTGVANMIRPDGTQPAPMGFAGGKAVNVPWGVSIDGNDDVWIGNFWGRGVVLMAGDDTKGHPEGTKTGDAIHLFQSGSIQMVTDVVIDPAGNAWVANNWNDPDAAGDADPARPTSTWGGGDGIVVIYGVASPVKIPLMGQVQQP